MPRNEQGICGGLIEPVRLGLVIGTSVLSRRLFEGEFFEAQRQWMELRVAVTEFSRFLCHEMDRTFAWATLPILGIVIV